MDNIERASSVSQSTSTDAATVIDVPDFQTTTNDYDRVVPSHTTGLLDPALPPRIITSTQFDSDSYRAINLVAGTGLLPVIASCPHAGRDYPAEFLDTASVGIDALRGLEDFGVDHLLPDFTAHGITCITNNIARAYLDVNRPADALDNTMFDGPVTSTIPSRHVRAGYGLVPRLTADRRPIYRSRHGTEEAARRINAVHRPYHNLLAAQMTKTSQDHGYALLIDFHSMPDSDRNNRRLPDIILGDCNGTTLDRRIGLTLADFFKNAGLSVAWNHPYAGGFITRNNGSLNNAHQSLQIEINRRLYMTTDSKMDIRRSGQIAALLGDFGSYLHHICSDGLLCTRLS